MGPLRDAVWFLVQQNFLDWSRPSTFPKVGLIQTPGSLWIDPLLRGNFTLDTNAMAVRLFRRFAEAEAFLGNATGAAAAVAVADRISDRLNALLWSGSGGRGGGGGGRNGSSGRTAAGVDTGGGGSGAGTGDRGGGDHFITQLNPDNSTLDMVDYDGNLLAVAHGVASSGRSASIMARIARGACARPNGYGTAVSEVPYTSPGHAHGAGDSFVTMGRIAFVDALALRRTNDSATFELLLGTLRGELLRNTWMYERWQCEGLPTHNPYYHEYAEVVAMIVHDVKCGIELGFGRLRVDPFGLGPSGSFRYRVGATEVRYSPSSVLLRFGQLAGPQAVTVTGLQRGGRFEVVTAADGTGASGVRTVRAQATADRDGELAFETECGAGLTTTIQLLPALAP
jgi:hypothetical protein